MNIDELRELSIENLTLLGKGTLGEVYALDDSKVVKVFKEGYDSEKIEDEYKRTLNAYEHKIPCPKVYEMVRVNGGLGIVMERLNAATMMDPVRLAAGEKDYDKLDFLMDEFVIRAKRIHDIKTHDRDFPNMRDHYIEITEDVLSKKLSKEGLDRIKELLQMIPDRDSFLHGDLNFSNVIYTGEQDDFRLIDVAAASAGDPILDINILPALHYLGQFNKLVYEVFNMDADTLYYVCEGVCRRYYKDLDPERYEKVRKLYYNSGALRLLIKLYEDGMLEAMPCQLVEKISEFI